MTYMKTKKQTKSRWTKLLSSFAIGVSLLLPVSALAEYKGPRSHNDYRPPAGIWAPGKGAAESGRYRSLFREAGYKQSDINSKINHMYWRYFRSEDNNPAGNKFRLFYTLNSDASQAFILNPTTGGNPSRDVRSEGQSYGMMIALQLNKRNDFDKLWKFAFKNMLQGKGPRQHYFCWQWSYHTKKCHDLNSAPDGEVYFAAALYMAHARWGSKSDNSFRNYKKWADNISSAMLRKPTARDPRTGLKIVSIINPFNNQIVFSPVDNGAKAPNYNPAKHTDPSYHAAHFFEYFSRVAPSRDRARWKKVAQKSRQYFATLKKNNPKTCLAPEYAKFSGWPIRADHNHKSIYYGSDSWRTLHNVGMDYAWWGNKHWVGPFFAMCQLSFFGDQNRGGGGLNPNKLYYQWYQLNGKKLSFDNYHRVPGQAAMNVGGVLAMRAKGNWPYLFVKDLWEVEDHTIFGNNDANQPPFFHRMPHGDYRYYDGMLYMLGMLSASGQYRVYYR